MNISNKLYNLSEPATVFAHELPRMVNADFRAGKVDAKLLEKPLNVTQKSRQLKMAQNPFANGAARLAYYGCDVTPFDGKFW